MLNLTFSVKPLARSRWVAAWAEELFVSRTRLVFSRLGQIIRWWFLFLSLWPRSRYWWWLQSHSSTLAGWLLRERRAKPCKGIALICMKERGGLVGYGGRMSNDSVHLAGFSSWQASLLALGPCWASVSYHHLVCNPPLLWLCNIHQR